MKTLRICLIFTVFVLINSSTTRSQYLDPGNITQVPIPTIQGSQGGFAYFDLSEINVVAPVYLDLTAVLNVTVGASTIKEGVWNTNLGSGIFSSYNDFYPENNTSGLNDIIFIQLRTNANKDVAIIKGNELKVYQNQNGSIQSVCFQTL